MRSGEFAEEGEKEMNFANGLDSCPDGSTSGGQMVSVKL
jgi:hypothetical protein